MLRTFSSGQNPEGWFPSAWPSWDMTQGLVQQHLGLLVRSSQGMILDHSLGFVLYVATHYLFSGDRKTLEEIYPRVVKFDNWLAAHAGADGMLPVTGWVWHQIWFDSGG